MRLKIIGSALFSAALVFIMAFTLFGKKETVSYNENKVLATMPKLTLSSYLDESFMNGVSDFFSDHFVFREKFIMIKNAFDKLTGRDEINGVIEADGGLIQLFRCPDDKTLERQMYFISDFAARSPKPVYFALAPTAQEQKKDKIKKHFLFDDEGEAIKKFYSELTGASAVDLTPVITPQDYLFYRTDHHWTSLCAYRAYEEICAAMGLTPAKGLKSKAVTDDFRGTLYSKTLNGRIKPDTVEGYDCGRGAKLTTGINEDIKEYPSLYFADRLDKKDKYEYFLGGNYGRASIEGGKGTGKLLIIKDSYTNALAPFFTENFSEITLLDLRYASPSELKSIDLSEYECILIIYNISGFAEEKSVSNLSFTGQ